MKQEIPIEQVANAFEIFGSIVPEIAGLSKDIKELRKEVAELKAGKSPAPLRKKKFLKVKEVAAELGISTTSVYRYIDRGLLKPSKASRHKLIPTEQIENFSKSVI